MKTLFLIGAISLVPMTQAFANVTLEYNLGKASVVLVNTKTNGRDMLAGVGTWSVPAGTYKINIANNSCAFPGKILAEGNRYLIFNSSKGCGIQDCGTSACPPLI